MTLPVNRVPVKSLRQSVDPDDPTDPTDPTDDYSWTDTLSQNDPETYLNTVTLDVGIPKQQLSLLLDLNSYMHFVYNVYCYQYHNETASCADPPMNVDMSYNFSASHTFRNYTQDKNNTKFYYNSGFRLNAALSYDQFCITDTVTCFTGQVFGNVAYLR
jgi:hypothetical protein